MELPEIEAGTASFENAPIANGTALGSPRFRAGTGRGRSELNRARANETTRQWPDGRHPRRAAGAYRRDRHHAVGASGGRSSTRGRYSTIWMRPSNVRWSIMSRATSG
jgi:hypothetical protein